MRIFPIIFSALLLSSCANSTSEQVGSAAAPLAVTTFVQDVTDAETALSNLQLDGLLAEVEKGSLTERKRVDGIPTFIMTFLDSLVPDFSLANPGEEWQEGCIVTGKSITRTVYDSAKKDSVLITSFDPSQPLPWRQLVYFGLGGNVALLSYYSGGFAKSTHIMLIQFDNSRVVAHWHGYGDGELKTQHEIVTYLKSPTAMHRSVNSPAMP